MQIRNGLDSLGGHGGHHREAHTKGGNETFALDQSECLTAFIEEADLNTGRDLSTRPQTTEQKNSHFGDGNRL